MTTRIISILNSTNPEINLDDRNKTLVLKAPSSLLLFSVNILPIHVCTYVCRSVIGYVGVNLNKYACVQAHTVHIVNLSVYC